MTLHALGELAGSRLQTLLHMNSSSAGGHRGRHLEMMTSYQKSDTVIDAYLLENNRAEFHPDPIKTMELRASPQQEQQQQY